jgi:hypothetical protein
VQAPGAWLVLAKKGTTEPTSLTYDQALEEALCHGWIDGQAGRRDESTYKQRFTPRRTFNKPRRVLINIPLPLYANTPAKRTAGVSNKAIIGINPNTFSFRFLVRPGVFFGAACATL